MSTLIKIKNITKDYKNGEVVTRVLKGVSFEIDDGEFVAIMGASGSGKSTLMHLIGFLDAPTSGEYYFEGHDTLKLDDDKLAEFRSEKVGFIFQSYNLLQRTSVLDNVLLPTTYLKGCDLKEAEDNAIKLLKKVGLGHRLNHRPNQLSGGEQQRVAIVRALVNNPRLILADEPTGNLDSRSGEEIMEILQKLSKEGRTIIMVTHEQYTAECARRILHIKDGLIVSDTVVGNQRIAVNGEFKK
ncbi:ATP-binding cassette domain-containing protein [Patescibacteria group bacterium]|nr:ATP-binding cassette domain-containing protein [Patescibacteria group bacterium]